MTRERDRIQENANKYIVKNCPAFSITPNKHGNACRIWCSSKPCQNRSGCLIKKIIQTTNDKKILDLFVMEVFE